MCITTPIQTIQYSNQPHIALHKRSKIVFSKIALTNTENADLLNADYGERTTFCSTLHHLTPTTLHHYSTKRNSNRVACYSGCDVLVCALHMYSAYSSVKRRSCKPLAATAVVYSLQMHEVHTAHQVCTNLIDWCLQLCNVDLWCRHSPLRDSYAHSCLTATPEL